MNHFRAIPLLSLLLLTHTAISQVLIGNDGLDKDDPTFFETPPNLVDACESSFNQTVTCSGLLSDVAYDDHFPSIEDLSNICTSGCLRSLESFGRSQTQACGKEHMTIGGKSYPATLTTDYLRWTYNYTCRRDAQSRDFCYPSFERWSDDGRRADAVGCSDCVLGTFQTQLNSHFGFDDDLASEFESLTSACKATAYPLTQTTAHSEASTTSEAASRRVTQTTAPCKQPYVVKQQDDCHSISLSQNVSTSSLLSLNNLQAHCTNFPPPATRLCLPSECNTYTVQADDTCWDIIQSHKNAFTLSQLVSWNPDINRGCDNLPQLAGNQICVSFAGESPHARNGHTPFSLTTAAVPTNIAKDTVTCCRKYYEVTQSDTCASITQKHGVTLKTFFSLNPELKKACDNLMLGYSYCVRAVDDTHVFQGHGGSGDRHNPCSGGVDDRPSSCYATTYKTGPDWSWPTRPAASSRRARQTRSAVGASVSSLAMRVPATSLPSLVWVAMHTAKS